MSNSSRGRSTSLKPALTEAPIPAVKGSSIHRRGSQAGSSGDSAGSTTNLAPIGIPFARSRSPISARQPTNLLATKTRRHASPLNTRVTKQKSLVGPITIFPACLDLRIRFPLTPWTFTFNVDLCKFGESLLLLGTLLYATLRFWPLPKAGFFPKAIFDVRYWLVTEIHCLCIASCLYFAWIHSSLSRDIPKSPQPVKELPQLTRPGSPMTAARPASPRIQEALRELKRVNRGTFGYVWMSVPKNYRASSDDGIFTGLLLGPLIAMALMINASRPFTSHWYKDILPAGWIIEAPKELHNVRGSYTAPQALLFARYSLVNLSTLCSTIMLLHIYASWWFERRYSITPGAGEGERTSVPRNEGRRAWYYTLFTVAVSTAVTTARVMLNERRIGIWQHLTIFETVVASVFFQFCLYIALRMAHRGFSLGELGLVCFGGTALWLEFLNLTIARLWPITTAFIKTYRLPTPLLTFQVALVAGSFLTGFLLSPFLVLSRNYAKRPAHRFRLPQENQAKERNRRYAALGFYVGTVIIVSGLIGLWTRWLLGNRDPWLWVIYRILEGRKKWHRPALLTYWGLLGCLSVAGWNRQLARSRKLRPRTVTAEYMLASISQDSSTSQTGEITSSSTAQSLQSSANALGVTFPNLPNLPSLPNLPNGVKVSHVATDLLDAADKHVPTLKLNARRKFFHGLVVVMFIPGVVLDPAFTHLSFNVAFALFIFAEYIRYFAIYPFGVAVHLFMNEFLDEKDGGTAILSHFYLLTGCAGSLWLEGPSRLLQFTGILALGVGDAVASVVGKRVGIHRWSPTNSKTVEGSLAFVVSVALSAWALRLLGSAEPFSGYSGPLYSFGLGPTTEVQMHDHLRRLHPSSTPMPELSHTDSSVAPPPSQCLTNGSLAHHAIQPPEPRLPSAVFLQKPGRKITRPSTAPAMEDVVMLPAGQAIQPRGGGGDDASYSMDSTALTPSVNGLPDSLTAIPTRDSDESVTLAPPSLTLASFPASYPTTQESSPRHPTAEARNQIESGNLDWPTFIHAYANGRWDPHRTPHRPRSSIQPIEVSKVPAIDSPKFDHSEMTSAPSTESLDGPITNVSSPSPPAELPPPPSAPAIENPEPHHPFAGLPAPAPSNGTSQEVQIVQRSTFLPFPNSNSSLKFRAMRPTMPLNLPSPAHRLRNSFSNISAPGDIFPATTPAANAELQTTVATMRWAAARVDISPLALPSPEHELADPMRGVTATIPGAHPPDIHPDFPITPGGTRRSRLTEFWEGTNDVEEDKTHQKQSSLSGSLRQDADDSDHLSQLVQATAPTMAASSLTSSNPTSPVSRRKSYLSLLASAPPATAPPREGHRAHDVDQDDYFGNVVLESTTTTTTDVDITTTEVVPEPEPDSSPSSEHHSPPTSAVRLETTQFSELGTVSVPAVARRVCLTRQFSSPLPAALPVKENNRVFGGRVVSEVQLPRVCRMTKEEQLFDELEYLVPPDPPDELERRKALYKYNIWNTGPDTNFDRIAHLAKLVFNTKGVTISLIDGGEIWHKSEWGLKVTNFLRSMSFCGHAILQRGDEPMVVMDTLSDWRFTRNPLVTGSSRIRFYAGAPLRTQDGFNVGTLTLIDDAPREEFSPRQRHTLKEFAAIVMREMELWRDKIQLRIRDRIQTSMEQFSRECLEIDEESHTRERSNSVGGASMDKVYDRAAKLVKRTLDVEGVIVMDVSHCQVLETMSAEANVSVTMHFGEPGTESRKQRLSTDEYHRMNAFFSKHPEGKISEGIVPACFRPFLPTHIQYALTVPIYNIDKQLFALICAYNASEHSKRFLEGHELSYLRAIGVIILSAVLKRRMILADKAKSLFISNISHELRTPLHGILAAAELLGDSPLNPSQLSYLQTVQACGTSLVETVNHVLDFTKLSGNSKSGGVEHVIVPSRVDLMQLVEEAVDGCWVGHRARTAIMGDSGIGSVYSPPKEESGESPVVTRRRHVETIIDIGYRQEGWSLKCEKGGIRRVLMNLFGNSLKFTSDGYIHVMLHQLPRSEDDPPNKVKVELVVLDSGKGISQNFLKNQLFHPFSQENPLQTGTGLGLAIVSSIVTSEVVGGKVDVWSQEGVGTEIKVTFSAEVDDDEYGEKEYEPNYMEPISTESGSLPTISLVGFEAPHRGTILLNRVLRSYLTTWWHFDVVTGAQNGDIVILNEDAGPVIAATENHDVSRPFVILSSARGSPSIMHVATEHERIGGFCRILYKPGGPSRLRSILKLAVRTITFGNCLERSITSEGSSNYTVDEAGFRVPRRNSEEGYSKRRPSMAPRSTSAFPALPTVSSTGELSEKERTRQTPVSPLVLSPSVNDHGSTHETMPPHDPGSPDPLADASRRKPILEISTDPRRNGDYLYNNFEGRTPLATAPGSANAETGAFTSPTTTLLETGATEVAESSTTVSQIASPTGDDQKLADGTQTHHDVNIPISSVVPVGESGTLLKSSILHDPNHRHIEPHVEKKFRVLVVEDNGILRNLLTKWLSNKGYEFRHAVDGQAGVSVYSEEGPFDVVLLDLSMPVLDGVSATAMIRKIEQEGSNRHHARILALTGMSSLEDKRRAFEAGVDGYLIKPVAFKILDEMFRKMGLV
ncbi:hypothetical protein NP233_g6075 [Leucocoprinus birnbaumii]|uniref:dolichol kinase n=1 Tax=Leucocoprinus birnbaumii TaxID=56174 RepID=A0AAD5VXA7_9AGAR|nr:hypothetical protein NP233_g6075 [Leucocoprinus birnbaumii]